MYHIINLRTIGASADLLSKALIFKLKAKKMNMNKSIGQALSFVRLSEYSHTVQPKRKVEGAKGVGDLKGALGLIGITGKPRSVQDCGRTRAAFLGTRSYKDNCLISRQLSRRLVQVPG